MLTSALAIGASSVEFVAGTTDECHDLHEECSAWASAGECENNLGYMRLYACRVSCNSCNLEVADVSPIAIVDQDYMASDAERRSCAARIPQQRLRWGASRQEASNVGCWSAIHGGHEAQGYWETTGLPRAAERAGARNATITFYDTATSKPLFVAPRNRTMSDFLSESRSLGWLSFRDSELVLENLRALRHTRGQVVSVDGMRLGVNRPDESASRYAVSLVAIAGHPPPLEQQQQQRDELR